MKFKDLPTEIRELAIEEYRRQHPRVKNLSKILEKDTSLDICWIRTEAGSRAWELLDRGKFTAFCRFYSIDVPAKPVSTVAILKDIISRCETTKRTTKSNTRTYKSQVSSKVVKSK